MALQDLIHRARTQFDQALQLVGSTLATQPVMHDIARVEAKNQYEEHLAGVFGDDFGVITDSQSQPNEKLLSLTKAFAEQKKAYEQVFSDTANREICMTQSLKALQKAFRKVLG